jgi:hypothetical protein
LKRKTSAEWADFVVGIAVIGLGLGFYAFTNATHTHNTRNLPVAAAGFHGTGR